jgi:anti-sigma factor RsiW
MARNDCVRLAPMIGAREGELAPSEAAALAAHLRTCGDCAALAADLAATEGLVSETLLAAANARDFAPFVDEVMARVARADPSTSPALGAGYAQGGRSVWAWLSRHRRAAAASLVPVLAALALIVYVRVDGGREPIALLELSSEGEVTTVLQTADGPVVLFTGESGT